MHHMPLIASGAGEYMLLYMLLNRQRKVRFLCKDTNKSHQNKFVLFLYRGRVLLQ